MSDWKNILKDIGYFGVGAAAVVLEAGGKAVKCLVRKGEKILSENQDTVDEMKQKAKEAGEKIKEAVQDLTQKDEAAPVVDEPAVDAPIVDEPTVDEPAVDEPVTPDAIYRTEEPAPADEAEAPADAEEEIKPEDTVNG